ncbi:hypothetical protein RND81_05G022700, partial [Saponaria officinalis]
IGSWNVRGCNDPLKLQEVTDFIGHNKLDAFGILETRVKDRRSQKFSKKFGRYKTLHNYYDCHYGGRIWVLWNPVSVSLTVLDRGSQLIHCSLVHLSSQRKFLVTFVYAFNRASERLDLWSHLQQLSMGLHLPWVCLGNFNVSLNYDERVGCVVHDREMQDFPDCLRYCSLVDHPYTRGVYTWHNKQDASPKWAKLDRVLVNRDWFLGMPSSTVTFLPSGISDHAPALLSVISSVPHQRPFRYLNCWASSSEFMACISRGWSASCFGGKIFSLFFRLRRIRADLKLIHTSEFSDLTARVAAAKGLLNNCKLLLQTSPTNSRLLAQEKQFLGAYACLKNAEMMALSQRAKVQYLMLNDVNTRYFYASVAAWRIRNTIGAIEDVHGQVCQGHSVVSRAFFGLLYEFAGYGCCYYCSSC